MRYDELLEEQKGELRQTYDFDDSITEPFEEWAEAFDYNDDDFGCTAMRNRSYDLMLPGNDVLTLCEDEIRALEHTVGKIITNGKELLETLSRLVQREVEAYAA